MSEQAMILERVEKIRGYECDFQQQLRTAVLFQYLTELAGVHADQLGVGFKDLLERNYYWVDSRMKIKFFDIPGYRDEIIIRTWPKTIQQKLFFIRDFEIFSSSGKKLAAATSAWLIIDASTRRLVPTASARLDLPSLPERQALDEPLEKLGLNGSGEERMRLKASYSMVDLQGHVNNSRYAEWISDCFPLDIYRSQRLDWIQINYNHEILPGEQVSLLVDQSLPDTNYFTVEGINRSRQAQSFECALHWRDL